MTAGGAARVAGAVALAAVAIVAWRGWFSGDERAIRSRLDALQSEVNASAAAGLESAARAAQIGSYFTEDAIVDVGRGATPIRGRETLAGMAARLQPRTAAFRLELDDVGIDVKVPGAEAEAALTASFVTRSIATGEESREVREFALVLVKDAGLWRISRATAVEVLKQ